MEVAHHENSIVLTTPEVKIKKSSTLADVVFGSISGLTGKLVEYPFDTIKVRLQTQPLVASAGNGPTFTGPWDCFIRTVRAEGFGGLYKGLSAPLIGSMIENSGLFFAYNQIQSVVRSTTSSDPSNEKLSISQLSLCGFLSGAIVSFVLTPIELVKCQLQVQGLSTHTGQESSHILGKNFSTNPFAMLARTLKTQGVAGVYRGHIGTFLRESGGGAAWFGTYEYVCKLFLESSSHSKNATKEDLTPWQLMGAGALAGMAYNASLFPADVIKSRQQTMTSGRTGFWQVGHDIYQAQGIRGFYRGCGITVVRSAPTSAVIFVTYEMLNRNFAF
ncbi:hypothetical protein HDU76_004215 [Blyttiomyces sp. JEL0837]|nr:hypothetical protein HDU76_004215 [Blyttiomyces sp. JEL0837]